MNIYYFNKYKRDYFMEIIFLGTSSAVHSYTRNHPAIVLKAFGETMLFDCGEGTQRQLIFAKVSPMKTSKTHSILLALNIRKKRKTYVKNGKQ